MIAAALLAATPATPIALLLACLYRPARRAMPALLWIAPLPALAACALAVGTPPLVLDTPLIRVRLTLDLPGALLLGAAAVLWIAAGASVGAAGLRDRGRFVVFWLLTLTGSLGVFVAADMAGFFLAYCLVSLAAWGLVVHDLTPRALRTGAVYVTVAVLGEALVLMGLVLLAAATHGGRLSIADAVSALPASPWRGMTLALLIAGFGAKIALLPLHVWMPPSYRAAPIPAAAVMGGAAVKAGVIGLIRFLPLAAAVPAWGEVLVAVGLLGAFWGVAVGITQDHPKTVLAYSSISQMGFVAALLGLALLAGDPAAVPPVAFYAACHVLVKGSLFLAIGAAGAGGTRRRWSVLLPAAILGLGLAGLPLTGAGLAKAAVKPLLGGGAVALLASLAAAGTALLMLHFLSRLAAMRPQRSEAEAAPGLVRPWLAAALAAIALPWLLYPAASGQAGADTLTPGAAWGALWPVLLGGAAAALLYRRRLPRVPEGNLLAAARSAMRVTVEWSAALERADEVLRRWPVAGLMLLSIALALGVTMLYGH